MLFTKTNAISFLKFKRFTPLQVSAGCLLLFLFLGLSLMGTAQDIPVPARPNPPRLVNDFVNLLSPAENNALEQKLVAYDDSTSTQIAIVIVRTVGDYAMVNYAVALGQKWGVGGKKFDNGIVILVASEDHKAFIATGYGMEGAIPDITAGEIINRDIIPNFKFEEYYKGLDLATTDLIKAAAGEYKASPHNQKKGGSGAVFFFLFIFIIIIVIFISSRGGGGNDNDGNGYNRRGRGYGLGPFLGGMFLGSMLGGGFRGGSSGGFGGGGFGGGGFGGFGGGGFGGGGAGGGW